MEQVVKSDLLSDVENEISMQPASVGARFVHMIVDVIVYYLLFAFIYGLMVGMSVISLNRLAEDGYTRSSDYMATQLYLTLMSTILWVIFYTVFEGATKGKTIGKYITGTRAVKDDGSPITWKDALIRSLIRLIPFEPFSAFGGYPWHDRWSHTRVVKRK